MAHSLAVTSQMCVASLFVVVFFCIFRSLRPPLIKHSIDTTAAETYGAIKMVRFVPLIAAVSTLGVTAGAPLPSTPEGEWTLLHVLEGKVNFRIGVERLEA